MFEKQANNVSQIVNQSFSSTEPRTNPVSSAGVNLAAAKTAASNAARPVAAEGNSRSIEDIFSQTDSSMPRPIPPINSGLQSSAYTVPSYSAYNEQFFGGRRFNLGGLVAIIVLLLVVGILAIMGWLLFTSKSPVDTLIDSGSVKEVVDINTNDGSQATQPIAGETGPEATQQPAQNTAVKAKDSDGDGLNDEEEKKYGTDPYSVDADRDGLTDRAEVKIYHTNPLNPDSDSDGNRDGEEVINGYDPARGGGAKLFEAPKK
ncbi:MAG: hypothetical protein WC516_02715 [Patescibacteria group bacterium]